MQDQPASVCATPFVPAEVLSGILQHVPVQQRLSHAFVDTAWAAAAALATKHVSITKCRQAELVPLWLQHHGEQVEQLLVDFIDGEGVLQLPSTLLPKLQHLGLQAAHVLPPGSSALAGSNDSNSTAVDNSGLGRSAALLPKLANLTITSCSMEHPSHLAQIIQAPELTRLSISELTFSDGSRVYERELKVRQEISAAVSDLLQRLPRLSVLHLPHLDLNTYVLQHIAAMSDLQDLNIILTPSLSACARGLSKLPSSITKLQLRDQRDGVKYGVDPSLPPRLQQLPLLLHLKLDLCVFQPTVLADLTGLQRLHLKDCHFRECFTETSGHLSGVAALLRAMQQLQLLQEFQLSANCTLGLLSGHPAPQLFAALTASSNLERLQLTATDQQPLPVGAMRHMFPQERTFPQLRDVSIVMLVEPDNPFAADDAQQWCMDSTDLASFISCCPRLQDLDITGAIKPSADVSALLQLPTSCTSLCVGGAAFTDTAAPVLAQLTHLKYLSWCNSDLTDTGLEQLTALTSLSRLFGYGNLEISDELFGAGGLQDADAAADSDPEQARWALDNKAFEICWSLGKVPVWEQLDRICDRSTALAHTRSLRRRTQVERLQAELWLVRGALDCSEARNAHLQQQLAAAQATQQQQ